VRPTGRFAVKTGPRYGDAGTPQFRIVEEYVAVRGPDHRLGYREPETGTARRLTGAMKPTENQLASLFVKAWTIVIDAKPHLIVAGADVNLHASSIVRVATRVVEKHRNELIQPLTGRYDDGRQPG
jgi:hypothetical protein